MEFSVGKIVGVPQKDGWAQVFALREEGRLPLFVCLDLKGEIEKDLAVLGREIFTVFQKEFFQKEGEPILSALKRAMEVAVGKVEEGLLEGEEIEFNLLCAVLKENFLYLGQLGEGQIWLWRRGKLGPILGQPAEKIKVASGKVEEGDILLLATPLFWQEITLGEIRAGLAGGEVEEVVSLLTPKIQGLESSSTIAALFVKFAREEVVFPERPVQIRKPVLRPKIRITREKRILLAALFLAFLLTLSLIKGITKKGYLARKAKFQSLSSQLQEKLAVAEEISSFKPEEAEKILAESEEIIKEMEKLKVEKTKMEEFKKKFAKKRGEILNIFKREPELVFDLNLIKKTEGVAISFKKGKVLVLSPGIVFGIDPEAKKGEMVGIEEKLNKGKFLAENFVFTPEGIFEVDLEEKKVKKVVEKEENWEEVKTFSVYRRNLYLLLPDQILKYPATASGYLSSRNWLKEKTDFSKALDLAIDGAIYVLKEGGKVEKFLRGEREFFQISLKEPILKVSACFTSPNLENFYLLDKEGRILVFDKTGKYQSQYFCSLLAEAKDFVVDPKEERIYFLVGSKIYRINV